MANGYVKTLNIIDNNVEKAIAAKAMQIPIIHKITFKQMPPIIPSREKCIMTPGILINPHEATLNQNNGR